MALRWQADIHRLLGMEPTAPFWYLLVLPVAVVTAALLVALCRLVRDGTRWAAARLGRWVPASAARVIAGVAAVALLIGVLNGVVLRGGRRLLPYAQWRDRPGERAHRRPSPLGRTGLAGVVGFAGQSGPAVRGGRTGPR